MKIDGVSLQLLAASTITDDCLHLPAGQLARPVYVAVNKVLEQLGGKWHRGKKCHVFESPGLQERLDIAIATGHITDLKKELQFFPTPPDLAAEVVALAQIESHHTVLEPSAGRGSIARLVPQCAGLFMVEKHPPFCDDLACETYFNSTYTVECADFMAWCPSPPHFDRIVMNPPFTKGQDMEHVVKAYRQHLAFGGIMVAIMSPHFIFASTPKAAEFRRWFDSVGGQIMREVEPGAFKSSGTSIATVIIRIQKSTGEDPR